MSRPGGVVGSPAPASPTGESWWRRGAVLVKRPLVRANLGLTAAVSVYSFWLASEGTWRPDHQWTFDTSRFYFWSQAKELLKGHLYVQTPPEGWLECFTVAGKCYGYFGVTPGVLRIPLVVLLGDRFGGLVPVMVAVAVGLAFWAAMDLVRQVMDRYAAANDGLSPSSLRRWFLLIGVLLGPGSVLMLVSRARIFEEAIAWSAAFLLLAMNLVYRWSRGRSTWALVGAVVAGVLSASARPGSILALVVLGIGVVVIAWSTPGATARVLGGCLAVVPAAVYTLVFVRKFGTVSIPWKYYGYYSPDLWPEYKRAIDANDGGVIGPQFALSTLATYLRPDSLSLDLAPPSVVLKYGYITMPPLRSEQLWGGLNAVVPSLTNLMPAPLSLTAVALIQNTGLIVRRRLRRVESMPLFLLLAGVAGGVSMITHFAMSGRYLGDLYPLMAVGTAFALPTVMDFAHGPRWWNRLVVPVLVVAALISTFIFFDTRKFAF